MKTLLEVDIGNSRIKWRIRRGTQEVSRGVSAHGDFSCATFPQMDEVRIVSVGSAQQLECVVSAFAARSVPTFIARSTACCAGVTNAYIDPASLGVDRWVALLGAFSRHGGGCIVIDVGTAITIDYLSNSGEHLGGYITPGIDMLFGALNVNTAGVRASVAGLGDLAPGNSTERCVNSGIALLVVGCVEGAIAYGKRVGCNKVILTGGGAFFLLDKGFDVLVDRDLVLDGLAVMAEQVAS